MQRELGIGVNATMRGDGLTKAATEIRQLEKSAGQLAREFLKAHNRVGQLNDEIRALDHRSEGYRETVKHLEKELFQASIELGKLQAQAKGAGLNTERLAEASERYQRELRQIKEGADAVEPAMAQMEQATSELRQETEDARLETDLFGRELRQLDSAQETAESGAVDLRQALAKATEEFEEAQKASIRLKKQFKDLRASGKGTEETLNALSDKINKAEQAEMKAIQRTRELIAKLEGAGDSTEEFAQDMDGLKKRLQNAEGYINGMSNKVVKMGEGFDKTGKKIDETNKNLGTLITKGPHIQALGNLISDGIQEAGRAIYEFGKESHEAFLNFDRQAREIFTLMPEATGEMRAALKRDVLAMGTELGRLPDEMLPAVYNALSAGIPEDNVLDTVRTASEAARAGVAELGTTLKLGVAILNSQVSGVQNINDVYDQLFFTIKNGVVTMPELTNVMSQVTSVAGEAGVSLQDISAAFIVMTRQGDSAAEAAELLSTMLTQLSTSGTAMATAFEQAAGQSFRQFIAGGGTLAEAMQLLQEHADRTGTALGDMLGGGSPFYRDTQAARGALELTGKHLQDLVTFSKEAESAAGSMATASAEMGEAAELGTLQYKAAVEELKIAIGEGLNPALTDLAINAREVVEVLSGSKARKISQLTEDIEDLAAAGEDLAAAGQRINRGWDVAHDSIIATAAGMDDAITDSAENIVRDLARSSDSLEEFRAGLAELQTTAGGQGIMDMFAGFQFDIEELFNAEQINEARNSLEAYYENYSYYTSAEDSLKERIVQRLEAQMRSTDDYVEAAEEQAVTAERLAELEQQRADAAIAAAEAELAAIEKTQKAFGNYVLQAANATDQQINWTDELFRSATAQGISQEQVILLAAATGEYSEEQVQAMLKTAAMRVAVEEFAGALAAGDITVQEAVQSLQDFEAQLDEEYKAEFDYANLENAEQAAMDVEAALRQAAGSYTAEFVTKYRTEGTPPTPPTNGNPNEPGGGPVAKAYGGRFRPGEWMIVGDGPGGQILPTTELVVFDRPGRIFSGQETNAMLNAPPTLPAGAAFNEFAPTDEKTAVEINVYITAERGNAQEIAENIKDPLMDAAREAGLI